MIETSPDPDRTRGPRVLDLEGADVRTRRAPAAPPPAEHESSLRDLVRTLFEERWLVAIVAVAGVALAALYLFTATPIYEGRIVVQVEDSQKRLAGLEDISAIFSEKKPAETEIAIMRSEVIIGSVISQLGLDVEAQPEISFFNRLLRRGGDASIEVRELSVSDSLLEEPMVLTALEGGRYRLTTSDGTDLAEGEVGARVSGPALPGGDLQVEIVVSELLAEPGTRFVARRRDRGDVIDGLRRRLRIAETGRGTGIIQVSLEGRDPEQLTEVLNTFASAYLRQNVDRKSAEAEKTLAFLDSQLPILKSNLARAEAALEEFQERKGTISLSRKTETMLDRTVDVDRELSELELQRTELQQRFTPQHPSVVSLDQKIGQLRAARAGMDARMREIPAAELESARLTRDQKVASQLYDVLLNKAQELRIVRSGIVGNVRILDHARVPRSPASPQRKVVLALGVLLGLGGGIAAALARRALDEGAVDPDDIEARVGVPVYVTIPHTDRQEHLQRDARGRRELRALTLVDPGDPAIEGLRSLRTALQFALVEARNNVIAIGSPAPGVGKSFVCVNLALLLANAGVRVLLVDADLRKGRLHRYFSMPREPGLSEALTGAAALDAALRSTDTENLHVLPTGRFPPNPAELLATQRFRQILDVLSPRYDFVLVDTPPVLAVTDPTLVARCAGVNLLVLRAGQHPYREINAAVKQFTQNGFPVQGLILNDARSTRHGYGRYGKYYEYRSDVH